MKKLFKAYWQQYDRLYTKKGLVVFMFAIYLGFLALLFYSGAFLESLPVINQASLDSGEYLKLPLVYDTVFWLASFFTVLWAVFFILFLRDELEAFPAMNMDYKTFLSAKLMFVFSIILDWILFSWLLAFLIGRRAGHTDYFYYEQIMALPVQMLLFLSMAFLAVALSKTKSGAIVLFLAYFFFEALVRKILFSAGISAGHYLPAKIATRLVEPPSIRFMSKYALKEYVSNNPLPFIMNWALALLYSVIFFFTGSKLLKSKL